MSTPNPERSFGQQPTQLGRHGFNQNKAECNFEPRTQHEALLWIIDLALPEITGYDGSPVQAELIKEEAMDRYPALFGVVLEQDNKPENSVRNVSFLDQFKDDMGRVDWNQVAANTSYASISRPLPRHLTTTDQNGTIQDKLPETVAV